MLRIRRKSLKRAFSKKKVSPDPVAQADRETAKPYRDDWWKEHLATQRHRELRGLVE